MGTPQTTPTFLHTVMFSVSSFLFFLSYVRPYTVNIDMSILNVMNDTVALPRAGFVLYTTEAPNIKKMLKLLFSNVKSPKPYT